MNRNDTHLYETLFRSHFRLAVFYAENLVGSPDAAQDIAQEVFVRLLDVDLSAIADPKRYLFRSVRNASYKYLRSRPSGQNLPLEETEALLASAIREDHSEADYHSLLDTLRELYEQVENLPPRARQIFKMIAIEHHTYAETAEKLSISLHSVKTQMSRSFQTLRKRMGRLAGILIIFH